MSFCQQVPAYAGDRAYTDLTIRRRLVACDIFSNGTIRARNLFADSAVIVDLGVDNATIEDLEITGSISGPGGGNTFLGDVTVTGNLIVLGDTMLTNVTITGDLEMCDGAALGTLLVGDGGTPNVMKCFDPVVDGAVMGQVLQYTGVGPCGVTWAGLSMIGVCTDVHGVNVGTGLGTAVCVEPVPAMGYPYAMGPGQIFSYDGAPLQTPANVAPGAQTGSQFGPAATGNDAVVTFDSTLLTSGMPKWTPVPTLDNSLLFYDTGFAAGSRLQWTGGAAGVDGNIIHITGGAPEWLANPGVASVLTNIGGTTAWSTGTVVPPGTATNDLLRWDGVSSWVLVPGSITAGDGAVIGGGGTTVYAPIVCGTDLEIPVRNSGAVADGYDCIAAPTGPNQMLSYDGAAATQAWSGTVATADNVLLSTLAGIPTWLANPGVPSVLSHSAGVTSWVAGSLLPPGLATNDLLRWDGISAWVLVPGSITGGDGPVIGGGGTPVYAPIVCGTDLEIPVRNSGAVADGFDCIAAPTGPNQVLSYDGAAATQAWSGTVATASNVLLSTLAGIPTWLANPGADSVLVQSAAGVTSWGAGTIVPAGLTTNDLLRWDGVSSWVIVPGSITGGDGPVIGGGGTTVYAPIVCGTDLEIPVRNSGAVADGFDCIAAPTGPNQVLSYDGAAATQAWSGTVATADNVMLSTLAGIPTWLANPGADSVLVQSAAGVTSWGAGTIVPAGLATNDLLRWDGVSSWVIVPGSITGGDGPVIGGGGTTVYAPIVCGTDLEIPVRNSGVVADGYDCIAAPTGPNQMLSYDGAAATQAWSGTVATASNVLLSTLAGIPTWLANPGADSVLVQSAAGVTSWGAGTIVPAGLATNDLLRWDGVSSWVIVPGSITGGDGPVIGGGGTTVYAPIVCGTDLEIPVRNSGVVADGYDCIAAPTGPNQLLAYDGAAATQAWSGTVATASNVLLSTLAGIPTWLANPGADSVLTQTAAGVTSWSAYTFCSTVHEVSVATGIGITTDCVAPVVGAAGSVLSYDGAIGQGAGMGVQFSTGAAAGAVGSTQVLGFDPPTGVPIWRGGVAGVAGDVLTLVGAAPTVPVWVTPTGGGGIISTAIASSQTGAAGLGGGAAVPVSFDVWFSSSGDITVPAGAGTTFTTVTAGTYVIFGTVSVTKSTGGGTTSYTVDLDQNGGIIASKTSLAIALGATTEISLTTVVVAAAADTFNLDVVRAAGGGTWAIDTAVGQILVMRTA